MTNRFQYSYFSVMLAAGWKAAHCSTATYPYVSIVPDAGDAQLRLTVSDPNGPQFDAHRWVENCAEVNRKKGRLVIAGTCGDFRGYMIQFESVNEWIRGWTLHHDSRALDASYRCPMKLRGRDNAAIGEMLASLQVVLDD